MRPEELPPPTAPPDEIRRAADEILARPEFQQPPETLYERIMGAISDALDDLLSALFEGGRSSVVAWVALAVVVGVIALLVTRILTSMRANPPGSEAISVEAEPRRPAVDWDREADAHAAAGRWRDAVRCRYRALVARLAARGVVDEVPGRTAGEYRLEVGGKRPAAGPPFGEATEVFERAWYGHRDTGRDDYEALDALSGDVLARSAS